MFDKLMRFPVIALVITLFFGGGLVLANDIGFTQSAVNSGKQQLDACVSTPKTQRFKCVGNALRSVVDEISQRPDYEPTARIITDAFKKIKATTKLKVAYAAIAVAKKLLLRASGLPKQHNVLFVSLMDRARSVLRK